MSELYLQKLSKYDRQCEPVTFSIPFASGRLREPERLRVWDQGVRLPMQARPLASWPDGSVKWLLVHLQPDLPGNRDKTLHFDIARQTETPPLPFSRLPLNVCETPEGVSITTGLLSFLVAHQGFWPVTNVHWKGKPFWARRVQRLRP